MFTNVTNAHGISVPLGSPFLGSGLSSVDYNGDGYDDITVATEGNGIHLYSYTPEGFILDEILPSTEHVTSVVWADYDNDGDQDLFAGVRNGVSMLWRQSFGEFFDVAEEVGIPQNPEALTSGASWGDYDLDGDLDLFICNYNWGDDIPNWFLNNEDGMFTLVDLGNTLTNEDYPTFMVTFADFDNDLYPDLYVINDKAPPNQLFKNKQNGTFEDVSLPSNTDIVTDAMSNSIQDYDRDGDLDIYVAADNTGNHLLRNEGNFIFTDVSQAQNIEVHRFCWGAQWLDCTNNGWHDLFIATHTPIDNNLNPFYINNQGESFQMNTSMFGFANINPTYATTRCDFNRDGYQDLLQTSETPYNISLWENNGLNNHWIGIELESNISNPDATGCWIECFGNDYYNTHYTLSGESYMGQNTRLVQFGLEDLNTVDSLVISWPSGWVDTIYPSSLDQYYTVSEGQSYSFEISAPSLQFCPGDSIQLDAGDYDNILWSDGYDERYRTVFEPGEFQVTVITDQGFSASSEVLTVSYAPEAEYELNIEPVTCYGDANGTVQFNSPNSTLWYQDEEAENDSLNGLAAGSIALQIVSDFGCNSEIEIIIPSPDELTIETLSTAPTCHDAENGSITAIAQGGTGQLTFSPDPSELMELPAGTYEITVLDEFGCAASILEELVAPDPIQIDFDITDAFEDDLGSCEAQVMGGTAPYTFSWSNGESSEMVSDLSPGNYILTVIDDNNCIATGTFTIELIVNIENLDHDKILSAFPNPFVDELAIQVQADRQWKVCDITGRILATGKGPTNLSNTSSWSPGIYVLLFENMSNIRQGIPLIHH